MAPDPAFAPLDSHDGELCDQFVRSAQWLLDRTEAVARRHTLPITTGEQVTESVAAHLEEHYRQAGWRSCTIFARSSAQGERTLPETRGPAPRQSHTYWLNLER